MRDLQLHGYRLDRRFAAFPSWQLGPESPKHGAGERLKSSNVPFCEPHSHAANLERQGSIGLESRELGIFQRAFSGFHAEHIKKLVLKFNRLIFVDCRSMSDLLHFMGVPYLVTEKQVR